MNWLLYSKLILKKVSFDRQLMRKEFRKAIDILNKEESDNLKEWYWNNLQKNKEKNESI